MREEMTSRYDVSVDAYCLTTNHIHVFATPKEKTSISNTMKVADSRYAQYINRNYQRTGTLFNNHLNDVDVDLIRKAGQYCQPVGDDRFNGAIENKYGIKPGQTRRGQPCLRDKDVVKI